MIKFIKVLSLFKLRHAFVIGSCRLTVKFFVIESVEVPSREVMPMGVNPYMCILLASCFASYCMSRNSDPT